MTFQYASRLYVDLILRGSSRWPNWTPTKAVEIGDFGKIDKVTGEFDRHGNIYTTEKILAEIPILASIDCQPKPATECRVEDLHWVSSESLAGRKAGLSPEVDIPGMGSASIKFDFTLQSGKNGAYLIMHRLRTITTPTSVPMLELAKIKALQGMFIVTEVVACPSYAMGIVAKGETNISVALSASPAVSFVTSGTANLEWQTSAATGTFRQTQAADDEPVFSVLYQLKKMSKPWKSFFFGSSKRAALEPEPDEANIWADVTEDSLPWTMLDEDGHEVSDEDSD